MAVVHAPGKAYLDLFVEMYLEAAGMSRLPEAGLGSESVMDAVKLCAAMFASAFQQKRPAGVQRVILVVEGVANEYNTRRRRNARAVEPPSLSARFAGGMRVLECLSLFEVQLMTSHDWHVKRTHNPRESVLFAQVLQQRSAAGVDGGNAEILGNEIQSNGGMEANGPIEINADGTAARGLQDCVLQHEVIDLC